MQDNHEILKLRVMLAFQNKESDANSVVKIARMLNVTKQRVSRILMEPEKEGLVDRSNSRHPRLTEEGERRAAHYAQRISDSVNHLLYEGVSIENVDQDAYHWALYNTNETMEVIRSSANRYRAKYELRNHKKFGGDLFCKTLGDGSYQFNFIILREHVKDGSNLSMANKGFEHPGTLVVKDGRETIYLRIISLTAPSPLDGQPVNGKVVGLKYMENGEFYPAEVSGDVVGFPASVLSFVSIGDNINQMLYGSVCLKMKCSINAVHMPESAR